MSTHTTATSKHTCTDPVRLMDGIGMRLSRMDVIITEWCDIFLFPVRIFENRICLHTTHFPSQFTGRICTQHKFIRISFVGIFIWSLTGTRIRERHTHTHTATQNVYRAHRVRCSKCDDVVKQIMTEWVNINKLNRVHACTDHRCIANTHDVDAFVVLIAH